MEEIYEEMQDLAATAPGFDPRPLINPNMKWVVRSGFQKAIRRGDTDLALWYGEFMYGIDDKYAWDTLSLIIVEDISIANPDLLSMSTLVTLKSTRDKLHADMLFSGMIAAACASVKCQAACELNLGADKRLELGITEAWQKKAAIESVLPENEEEEMFPLLHHEDLETAFIAMKVLRQRLRNKKPEVLLPVLGYIMEQVDDYNLARAAMMSFERTVDTMNLAVFPLVMQMQRSKSAYTIIDEKKFWPESRKIKVRIPSEAYDMHVREGKMAIKVLYKNALEQDHSWATALDPKDATLALGSCVFIQEGGNVDRRLGNDWLAGLREYQFYNFMRGYGFGKDNDKYHDPARQYVKTHISKLNDLREWAVSKSE